MIRIENSVVLGKTKSVVFWGAKNNRVLLLKQSHFGYMVTDEMDNYLMDFGGFNVLKTLPKEMLEIVHRNGSRCTSNIVKFPCRLFVEFCDINVQFISPIYPWKRCNF